MEENENDPMTNHLTICVGRKWFYRAMRHRMLGVAENGHYNIGHLHARFCRLIKANNRPRPT